MLLLGLGGERLLGLHALGRRLGIKHPRDGGPGALGGALKCRCYGLVGLVGLVGLAAWLVIAMLSRALVSFVDEGTKTILSTCRSLSKFGLSAFKCTNNESTWNSRDSTSTRNNAKHD